jgi:hypothetical protein
MIYPPEVRSLKSEVKKFSRFAAAGIYGLTVLSISFVSCSKKNIVDEAKASGKTAADFPEITADVFAPMDGGIQLAPDEIMGRNAWILFLSNERRYPVTTIETNREGIAQSSSRVASSKQVSGFYRRRGALLWDGAARRRQAGPARIP